MRVWEYLKNACLGWQKYLDAENYIVFFLLFLFCRYFSSFSFSKTCCFFFFTFLFSC